MGDVGVDRFREIFRAFPTGLTVVTCVDENAVPHGMTCNAVSAVSLRPALLLVCLDERARTLGAVRRSGAFAVNFLAEGAEAVAELFAGKSDTKFAGLSWETGPAASPILSEWTAAYAVCRVVREIQAGDHSVLLGRVVAGAASGRPPLLHDPAASLPTGRTAS
ncbi:flavin reductase family protein [Streptomyces sp. NPDC048106]|uniref:flavin reductase family protein n=1 Tax=Streptomyces sp. NPDC048106 TaxID=3155750 RepID=UPI0034523536